MTITIDATYSGSTTNSFVDTVDEADAIASELAYLPFIAFNAVSWAAAGEAPKAFALIFAGASLGQLNYVGSRRLASQSMPWPRIDTGRVQWNHIDGSEIIPTEMKWAQVMEAASLLAQRSDTQAQRGVLSEALGDHAVSFDKSHLANASVNVSQPTNDLLQRAGLIPTGSSHIHIPRG